ncbi:MAG: Sec-independent protein translocase protein TatA [Candidatus Roizmanbacteria bacterium GW2011_GWA2_35_19]|uniref:Sec-independent protein translocase protein TatA n=1 Tax=Candidatus Roizmanbacteria bacterium GW2011_GWA2_35_19 TaxID=1618478 RepID=A0A0G0BSH8_9BACT|nr:MAG: Sec-independent protein translocase protein TatA [Candidatus Roizmanbacteria bacterium GW2011_GWA2_35_19]
MFGLDTKEIILIAVVLLVLFGSQKMVEFARGLGEAKKELGKVKKELKDE